MFLSINFVATPPIVSIPSDKGITSNKSTSLTSPCKIPAWIAAPSATTSSGLIDKLGSLLNNSLTAFLIAGILVCPPTKITSSMSSILKGEFSIALLVISIDFEIYSSDNSSNLDRVIFIKRCFGPSDPEVIKGILISVSCAVESSNLAFSADSSNLCKARVSLLISIPESFLNSAIIH